MEFLLWASSSPFLFGGFIGLMFGIMAGMITEKVLGRRERREHRQWVMRSPVTVTLTEDQVTAIMDRRLLGEEAQP